jgi:hypothetical protein
VSDKERGLVSLAECPPGPFLFEGTLGFKTEYGATRAIGPVNVPGDQIRWIVTDWPDAYCMESGEYFWGGTTSHEERARLLVEPVDVMVAHQEPVAE